MIDKFILIVLCTLQVLATDTPNNEFYKNMEENADIITKLMFTKLNEILIENQQLKKDLTEIGKSQNTQNELMDNLIDEMEDLTLELEKINEGKENKKKALELENKELHLALQNFTKREQKLVENEKVLLKKCTESVKEALHLNKTGIDIFIKQHKSKVPDYIKKKNLKTYCNCNWIVIQRREDGSVDFDRNWKDFKNGFGNPTGEFFIGLESLYKMTSSGVPFELLIVLKDFHNEIRHAQYERFEITNEENKYAIYDVGKYSGDAGNELSYNAEEKFTTKDQRNDWNKTDCYQTHKSAWWFYDCTTSNLNGPYVPNLEGEHEGIFWHGWHGNEYAYKFVEMMIRPKV